jgi:chromosome partitioning protein
MSEPDRAGSGHPAANDPTPPPASPANDLGWPPTAPAPAASPLGWPSPNGSAAADGDAGVSRETFPGHQRVGEPRVVSRETWPSPGTCRVICVANQKGGVGKTTTTVNIAAALAQHHLRVLVVDLDPQGNASTALAVPHTEGTPSAYEVLIDGRAVDDVTADVDDIPGLRCLPASIDLAGAEIGLVALVARESRLKTALAAVTDRYDYVFIDCPPSLGLLTLNALVAAEEVLIPIQCEFYALEGLTQLLRTLDMVRAHLNPGLAVSTILLTMYDGRTKLADQVAEEVRNHFGDLVLASMIPRSVRISEAPGFGQTVLTYDPGSRGAVAYIDAGRELAERAVVGAGGRNQS